jgi:hypothetical protein
MIKKKFSNLYTSFRKMHNGHHLNAYFCVDVFSLMQESLKFPTLYNAADLLDYIISTRIIPKKRNPRGKLLTNYSIPNLEFITEDEFIAPTTLSLAGGQQYYVYFTFDQHFNPFEIRKYEFQMEVLDLSIKKALELKEQAIQTISVLDRYGIPDFVPAGSKKLFLGQYGQGALELVDLCQKLQGITGRSKEVYDKAQEPDYWFTNKTYNLIRTEIMKDISYINRRTNTRTRDYGTTANSTAVSKLADPIRYIRNEFGSAVKPEIKQNLFNNLEISNGFTSNQSNQALYTSTLEMSTVAVSDLPTIEDKFEKFHRYEDSPTLKQKAENLNLNFVCLDASDRNPAATKMAFIESQSLDDVYVLVGHANNSVSSPNFVLLSEASSNLLNNSTYLCKTHYIDGENQYFLLGT